mmetsp:Transcript_67922/g.120637  ORF Transcript_67922/g.120637 Transcript_67922/m.120637 type:complete len:810 (+) Transcript_67922:1-2430(+)
MACTRFDGTYQQNGLVVGHIRDGVVSWVDGPSVRLEDPSGQDFTVRLPGYPDLKGHLDISSCSLVWSDGDVWRQESEAEEDAQSSSDESYVLEPLGKKSKRAPQDRWTASVGQGGAGTSGAGGITIYKSKSEYQRQPLACSTLLPNRMDAFPNINLDLAIAHTMASKPNDGFRHSMTDWGEYCVRIMHSGTVKPIMLIELNHVDQFNMMDLELCIDLGWACAIMSERRGRYAFSDGQMQCCVAQGAGPHFCPGGNPNPTPHFGITEYDASMFVGYRGFITAQRQLALGSINAGHGAMVGGGNAFALNCTVRMAANQCTFSFGNVSRGMVPGMMLCKTIGSTLIHSPMMDFYLTDNTFSAAGALNGNFVSAVVGGPPLNVKSRALEYAYDFSSEYCKLGAPSILYPTDWTVFADEIRGITLSGRAGQTFVSLTFKAKSKMLNLDEEANSALASLYGQGKGKGKGKGKKGKKGKRRPLALDALAAKAGVVHGLGVQGGILTWAKFISDGCWGSMESKAPVIPAKGGPCKYIDEETKSKHSKVYDVAAEQFKVWRGKTDESGVRQLDVATIAEVAALCLWRERAWATSAKTKEAVPPEQLEESDPRKASNMGAMPLIEVDHGTGMDVIFQDPQDLFAGNTNLWWQFIAMDSSRMAVSTLIAVLLGCLAKPGVQLTLNGEEVADFGICRGKFKGTAKPLCIVDVKLASKFFMPPVTPKHDWVFVRTVSGAETVIDLAAAEYGDFTMSPNVKVPLVMKPAAEYTTNYVEESRDWDPINLYREAFQDMLKESSSGSIQDFMFVSGKACAYLNLLS